MTSALPPRSLTVLHGSLAVGGIEQLLVRVAEGLHARGWTIQFVLQARADSVLDRRAEAVGQVHLLPSDYRDAWPAARRLPLAPTSVVFAPTSDAYVLAHLLRRRLLPGVPVVAGVYYPLEYANRAAHAVYEIGLAARLLAAAPEENVVFMNEACRAEHAAALGRSFQASPVIPVPVDAPAVPDPHRRSPSRIVSIGRLVDFKGYPFGALEALRALSREGRELHYDVYGEGPVRPELEATIDRLGLRDRVSLLGEVSPDRFAEACQDALAFLGMGTAAVEAAALGVPTLLAAVGERGPSVHGWFSDQQGFGVGEVRPGDRMRPMTDLLRSVHDLDEAGYAALSAAHRSRAEAFSLEGVLDAFEAVLAGAAPDRRSLSRLDLVRGWADRVRDSRHVRGARPSRRAQRYLVPQR